MQFCSRLFFPQEGGEGAVVVGVRQDELLLDKREIRMGLEEGFYLQVVLVRFDGTCAVNETAIWFEGQRSLMEDLRLDGGEFRKFLEVERPFGVRLAFQNACVGAWNIQQNGVQRRRRLELRGVHLRNRYAGEAFQIFLQPCKFRFCNIIRIENARVFQRFRQQDGLASGRGAQIGDNFAGLGREKRRCEQRRGILYVESCVGTKYVRDGHAGLAVQFVDFCIGCPFRRFDGNDSFEFLWRLLRRIFAQAEERVRLLQHGFGDGRRHVFSIMFLPTAPEAFRKTQLDMARRVVEEMIFLVQISADGSETCIYESCLLRGVATFHERCGGIDDMWRGHARKKDDFRQRPAEDLPCARANFACGMLID